MIIMFTLPFLAYLGDLSKPITYAIALNELGNETVHKYVGTEPSGRMFNAIVLDYNGEFCRVLVEQQQLTSCRPFIVMINPAPVLLMDCKL